MARQILTPSNLRTARLELSGIEEYLEKIKRAGNNVDEYVENAIDESAKIIYKDIEKWAEKHKMTGAVLEGIRRTDVQKEGNNYFVDVGIDTSLSPNSWHAVFVEYGTPTNPADPGIRPAFDNNKSKIKRIQRQVLAQGGVPVE